MRTVICSTLIVSFLTIAACKSTPRLKLTNDEKNSLSVDSVLTRASTADSGKSYYYALCDTVFKERDTPLISYTIRAQDLLAAMGLSANVLDSVTFKYVRVYLGYAKNDGRHRLKGFRLYINPVQGADLDGNPVSPGIDIMLDSLGHPILDRKGAVSATPYVLDLNAPCPKTCAL